VSASPIPRAPMSASRATIRSTWLTGTALVAGLGETPVTLQQAPSATGPFVNVQTVTSVRSGEFAFGPQTPSATTYYRAVAGSMVSAPLQVAVRFRIGLFVSKSHSRRGGLVRFHGTVAPAHNGGHVLLQWLGPNHRWQTVRRLRLHRAGTGASAYGTVIRLSRGGRWRAVVQPDLQNAKGFSQVRRIRLHGTS